MYKIITYLIATVIFTALVVANVGVSGSLSTGGEKLRQIQVEQKRLVEENQALEAEILANTSLSTLAQKAQEKGFVKPQEVIAIQPTSTAVAYNH